MGVALESIERRGASRWLVTWRIADHGSEPFSVVEAWHPHGKFRSSRLRRSLRVPPRTASSLELPARIDAQPGEQVENCFLILRISRRRERWRVLARFTLVMDEAGTPRARVEAVDVHAAER